MRRVGLLIMCCVMVEAASIVAVSAVEVTPDAWLCITEQAAGMTYDVKTQQWKATVFNKITNFEKFVIRHTNHDDIDFNRIPFDTKVPSETKWSYAEFGDKFGWGCPSESDISADFNKHEILTCGGPMILHFNKNNLRFEIDSGFGYVIDSEKEGSSTPFIEIGKCTPI